MFLLKGNFTWKTTSSEKKINKILISCSQRKFVMEKNEFRNRCINSNIMAP